MLEGHRLGAIMEVWHLATKLNDGCACTVCWPAVLLKLQLVPVSDYIKNIEYAGDRKFAEVYVCQKLL